ncbi:glycosyltransferase family 2 protein [Oleidesulfovibrio sp.]|uniref:glycosyltransferase family 2 protein n=1 Tax=Oleidesulfovibrio sp. TaxID=2909707 RepID=UPI003A8A0247
MAIRYSIITPSRGDRPNALIQALTSVLTSADHGGIPATEYEVLVGFDGVKGPQVLVAPQIRYYNFPADNDFGNGIRNGLLKAAKGQRILFVDDDNALTLTAFNTYEKHCGIEMLISRIDVSRAHDKLWLPVIEDGVEPIRQSNIDPLCLCLTKELVVTRCGGWQGKGYQADYVNMFRYYRRAKSLKLTDEVVGVYDVGRGLDESGLNFRQQALIS